MVKNVYMLEFRAGAVKIVVDTNRPVTVVARELGISEGILSVWVQRWRKENTVDKTALNIDERARLRQLEKVSRELRMENEFLKKAAAFFAKNQP